MLSRRISTVLVLLGLISTSALGQLTSANHQALVRLAKTELSRVLSQTHSGHTGEFNDPHKDLENLVLATQALEILGAKEAFNAQEVCGVIKKNIKHLVEQPTVAQIYHLAEVYRVYQCDSLKGVPEQVSSVLKKDVEKMTKPSNLYYAYLLNEGGKAYG
jgi:hypothetical protein